MEEEDEEKEGVIFWLLVKLFTPVGGAEVIGEFAADKTDGVEGSESS